MWILFSTTIKLVCVVLESVNLISNVGFAEVRGQTRQVWTFWAFFQCFGGNIGGHKDYSLLIIFNCCIFDFNSIIPSLQWVPWRRNTKNSWSELNLARFGSFFTAFGGFGEKWGVFGKHLEVGQAGIFLIKKFWSYIFTLKTKSGIDFLALAQSGSWWDNHLSWLCYQVLNNRSCKHGIGFS